MKRFTMLGLALGLLASGCHNFTIVNGKPAMTETAAGYDDKLHSAIIGDVVVIDKPVNLTNVCPQGWAKIDRRVTFVDGLIDMLASVTAAGGVYKADSISITCAEGSTAAPPASTPSTPPPTDPPVPPTSL